MSLFSCRAPDSSNRRIEDYADCRSYLGHQQQGELADEARAMIAELE